MFVSYLVSNLGAKVANYDLLDKSFIKFDI